MYDFAHPLEDAFEGVTHSICTLEFESNRELYDWVLDRLGPWDPRPRQYEFARLALGYTVLSKRKLLQLVNEGRVDGLGRPAHADHRRDAPARRDAGGAARLRRAHRRREEQQRGGHRQARVRDPRRPRGALAARARGARPDPARRDRLARGEDRGPRRPVVAWRRDPPRDEEGPVRPRPARRARGLLARPAEGLAAARARARGPARRRLRRPLHRRRPRARPAR